MIYFLYQTFYNFLLFKNSLKSSHKSSLLRAKSIVACKNQNLSQVSYLFHSISSQYISLSFIIIAKASASLFSQSFQELDFSKYSKISGVKTYFHITHSLEVVSLYKGFSKNFDTLCKLSSLYLVSIIQ